MNRRFIVFAIAIIALGIGVYALFHFGGRGPSANKPLVVLSYGGEFEAAQRAAFFDPFTKETGVAIANASYDGEYGKLKATVSSLRDFRISC